ncbi:hypothetical protein GCM10011409_08750 [Lentibacillus populi]|uniref:Uncharacterized protein n=1 Tax=Lentibacillus populi TaxID=1827502 RepID=A0A9W5TVJ8_9BACI|nr:hypothetical protein [Lentibacillus populi]GGB33574.1 hypothetical protein GCM10011409_08750 [Lentibacillus populi]
MTNGLLFLWFAWMLWIIVTFFMKKGTKRTYFACIILLLINCSNTTLKIGDYHVLLSFIVLLAGLLFFHSVAQSFYLLFSSFTICLGYTAILFWEQITPIWMFLPRVILIPLTLTIIITILTKQFEKRLAIGLIGITCGEIYHSFILTSYTIQEVIGDKAFFDMILTFIMLQTILEILHKGKLAIYTFSQNIGQPLQPVKNKTRKTMNG